MNTGPSLREALAEARKAKRAIGHFNISDLAGLHAIASAARTVGVPVIIGLSEGERSFINAREAVALVALARERTGVLLYLNADHTHSQESALEAVRAGFDQVIFDGSRLPIDRNIEETKRVIAAARAVNPRIIVEGELGYIGTSSEILAEVPHGIERTDPHEAAEFVMATGVDVLAPAVGNMHGLLASMVAGTAEKRLDIVRIRAIADATDRPLTLHGGSGTADEDFRAAIAAGVAIVHVNTELRLAWRRGVERALENDPHEVAPYKLLDLARTEMEEIVRRRLRLFSGLA